MAVKSVTLFLCVNMNWIDKLFRREAAVVEAKTQAAVGAAYKQNVVWANTPTRAMKIAAVFRAVNLISSGLASLKLEYKRKDRVKGYFKFDNGKMYCSEVVWIIYKDNGIELCKPRKVSSFIMTRIPKVKKLMLKRNISMSQTVVAPVDIYKAI